MPDPVVVLIEDELQIRRFLRATLAGQGYRLFETATGADGLIEVASRQPDVVIVDLGLPDMDGLEVLRGLRAWTTVPVIVLSARHQDDAKVAALDGGADDYVTKPFSIRELLARAKAFLRRRTAASTVLQLGDCRLDLTAHKLFRNGKEVALTTKEFRLLEFFARRPGRALTRDQILDGVWGNEIVVSDRSVDRCVTTLRAKIEPDPRHPVWVQTIRDIGYRYEHA